MALQQLADWGKRTCPARESLRGRPAPEQLRSECLIRRAPDEQTFKFLQLPSSQGHGRPGGQVECCSADSRSLLAVKLQGFCSLAFPPNFAFLVNFFRMSVYIYSAKPIFPFLFHIKHCGQIIGGQGQLVGISPSPRPLQKCPPGV